MTIIGSTSTTTTTSTIGGTYGLSGSGVDVDSIVKKLMAGQQAVEDSLTQKQTVLQWQKSAYNTVYDDLNTFKTSTLFNYKLQATLSPNKVSSSNTSVATATANASAANVNHSLVVAQLASGVNLTSTASISTGTMGTLAQQFGMTSTDSFQITLSNGSSASQTITIDPTTDTINDVVSKINSAGINVQANYDSTLDRFFLSTTNVGASSGISFAGSDQAGLDFLGGTLKLNGGITETSPGSGTYTSSPVTGQDAAFQLDGVGLTENSNTFTISGVTYSLTGVSSGLSYDNTTKQFSGQGQATSIGVTSDIDTAVSNVQAFVDAYNKILAELNGDITQPRYSSYPPLTSSQKSSMSDSDITLWNQKAQSGMLYNDSTLTSLVNSIRSSVSSPVSGITGPYNSLSSIGITTGDYTEGGKLSLNTDTLRAALQANPNVLNQLFGSTGTKTTDSSGVTKTDFSTQGVAGRLYDTIQNSMTQIQQIAGTTATASYDSDSNLAVEIQAYAKRITDAQNTYNTMQSQYYTQYNAMEVAIQQLSAQSGWLASMLGTSSS
ncbi:flagellar filament capping protein FliD [Desulfosporosinus sp. PR]|uniref:flagellar filament capping protein FliD n=1 Tax=Candidatus Desulfosporosinus nitrosoreducens TaxID=3401928 RepID=UPI0027EF6AE9|nr:flagellar filament capping protein FliD [Desulfosporosinus sp. PR]MDQ7096245.1 flagellar filament capping protein FliD [Desulfosporosinus sp. PR]